MCVWDEFSEYLLENRVPTSADFNTYAIRIFNLTFACNRYLLSSKYSNTKGQLISNNT